MKKNINKVNLFIVGFPKSGTTSLYEALSGLKNFDFGRIKESNFFCEDIMPDYCFAKNLSEYESLYEFYSDEKFIKVDSSIANIYSKKAIKNILKYNPLAKFIILYRDPHKMAVSLYSYLFSNGHENIKSFEDAILLSGNRDRKKNIPNSCLVPFYLDYLNSCSLYKHTNNLLNYIDKENLMVIKNTELSNSHLIKRNIENFMGIDFEGDFTIKKINETRKVRNNFIHNIFMSTWAFKRQYFNKINFGLSSIYFSLFLNKKNLDFDKMWSSNELRQTYNLINDDYKKFEILINDN
jgi:hypothetical protein